ncbi:MAG: AEC family transporter [Candidatus Omnitrophica bacterium]|nr:AEC family transporter [Candidatus Omnitrophota bacterium]
MFLESFKITAVAVFQIFLLAAIGYFLVKKKFLVNEGLDALSRLVMDVTLPLLIFYQLVKDFTFSLYPNWWIFPLISIGVTLIGLLTGFLFLGLIKGQQHRLQFLSLVAFQNSGYLPLALVAVLLPQDKLAAMFIYIFLFLTGFNLVMFSLGVYILNFHKEKKFDFKSLFSIPVAVTIFSLILVLLGLHKFIPEIILKPLKLIGDTTLPLALLVVGGNLAEFDLKQINKRAVSLLILVKMIILPLIGLWLIIILRLPDLIGLLILIQLAMPSAVTLSVILRSYKREDLLVSQGIFFTHIASVLTIPVFLILYFSRIMLK